MPAVIFKITRHTKYEDLPEWLTQKETAAHLGVTYWAVNQAIHRGEIPYRRLGLKLIYIPKRFFDPAVARSQVTSAPGQTVRP
jgi:excisionase family DNA binding protein